MLKKIWGWASAVLLLCVVGAGFARILEPTLRDTTYSSAISACKGKDAACRGRLNIRFDRCFAANTQRVGVGKSARLELKEAGVPFRSCVEASESESAAALSR